MDYNVTNPALTFHDTHFHPEDYSKIVTFIILFVIIFQSEQNMADARRAVINAVSLPFLLVNDLIFAFGSLLTSRVFRGIGRGIWAYFIFTDELIDAFVDVMLKLGNAIFSKILLKLGDIMDDKMLRLIVCLHILRLIIAAERAVHTCGHILLEFSSVFKNVMIEYFCKPAMFQTRRWVLDPIIRAAKSFGTAIGSYDYENLATVVANKIFGTPIDYDDDSTDTSFEEALEPADTSSPTTTYMYPETAVELADMSINPPFGSTYASTAPTTPQTESNATIMSSIASDSDTESIFTPNHSHHNDHISRINEEEGYMLLPDSDTILAFCQAVGEIVRGTGSSTQLVDTLLALEGDKSFKVPLDEVEMKRDIRRILTADLGGLSRSE